MSTAMTVRSMRVDAETVPARVRHDHRTLRGLLVTAVREAAYAADANGGREHVRLALTALRDALLLHLDYEERELVPLLRAGSAWGPVLAAQVASDHGAHRASMTALVEDADENGARKLVDLAEEVAWFAEGLGRDMGQEEAKLLAPMALGREQVVAEQTDG